jgi:hypothetical protein
MITTKKQQNLLPNECFTIQSSHPGTLYSPAIMPTFKVSQKITGLKHGSTSGNVS